MAISDGFWVSPIAAEMGEDALLSIVLPIAVIAGPNGNTVLLPVFNTRLDAEEMGLPLAPQHFDRYILRDMVPVGTALVIDYGSDRQVIVRYEQWSDDSQSVHHGRDAQLSSDSSTWLRQLANKLREQVE